MTSTPLPTRPRPRTFKGWAISLAAVFVGAAGLIAGVALTGQEFPWQMRPTPVQIHLATVIPALAAWQLVARKGTRPHKMLGYAWCALMVVSTVASFFIALGPEGTPVPIKIVARVLSILTLILIPVLIHAGLTHRPKRHRLALFWIFGIMIFAALFAAVPVRTFGELATTLFL